MLTVCIIIGVAGWWVFNRTLHSWRPALKNIPGPKNSLWLTGHLTQLVDHDGWSFHRSLLLDYGRVVVTRGFLGSRNLFVFDPKSMQHIFIHDHDTYDEWDIFIQVNRLVFGMGIISTTGQQHREQRKMLTPAFSVNHLRMMLPDFYHIANQLCCSIDSRITGSRGECDMLELVSKTALELIGKSGMGYTFDSFKERSVGSPYARSIKNLLPTLTSLSLFMLLVPLVVKIGPPSFRRMLVDILPWSTLHEIRDMVDTIHQTSVEILESKRTQMENEPDLLGDTHKGKTDIISILLKDNLMADESRRLPEPEIIAHMSSLIFAAMDTTSGALCRLLHVLAQNSDVQDELRYAILEGKKHGTEELVYEELMTLPLLDAVCKETMRLYPPITTVNRTAIRDTILPVSVPIRGIDGTLMNEIHVPKGTDITVSLLGANTDKAVWGDDAEEWKPKRWLVDLPRSVVEARIPGIYSNMMSFLGGSRACIGFKFAELEMKVVLSVLLTRFKFSLSEREVQWQKSIVACPTVDGESRLPLCVEVVA